MSNPNLSDGGALDEVSAVRYLRTADAVRDRCRGLFELGLDGRLEHFHVRMDKLSHVVNLVHSEITAEYPDIAVPFHSRWRHFDAGGVERLKSLDTALSALPVLERVRSKLELAIVSVLLDAGAGMGWEFRESNDSPVLKRSEGLAVASLQAFDQGLFGAPRTVTAQGLMEVDREKLSRVFQVTPSNPLVGLEGRVSLMNRLGKAIHDRPNVFSSAHFRLGGLLEAISALRGEGGVSAPAILSLVLELFAPIWPGRLNLAGHNLGDVWIHSKTQTSDCTSGFVPFHKLSQWLTYSLLEPLIEGGIGVMDIDRLTGLAEYRNGGLFLDSGLLELRDPSKASIAHVPSSELIVEWRALTVALLDKVADGLRSKLSLSAVELPLAKVLQGGTWSVGRKLAFERSADGAPPLRLESDGTVF